MTETSEASVSAQEKRARGVSIRVIGAIAIAVAILLAFYAFALAGFVADAEEGAKADEARYVACSEAITELQEASDYLTTQARMYVVTGRKRCMEAYLEELNVTNRRGSAVEKLKSSFSDDLAATTELMNALVASNNLAKSELSAMRLAADYYGVENVPAQLAQSEAVEGESALDAQSKLSTARELVLGEDYDDDKRAITASVEAASTALLAELDSEGEASTMRMQNLLFQLRVVVALLLCVVMVLVLVLLMYVLKPLSRYIRRIEKSEPLEADGSYELHYLANAYNAMYEDNSKRIEQLRISAERDPLTGIANRNGYNNFLATHTRNVALLLIDIDDFKEFNHVYGHDTGDAVMVKLADALSTAFRSTDFPCRIESDKFAVIMTNMGPDLRDAVVTKIDLVNSMLADDSDSLPLITLSVGAAFSTEGMSDADIYRAAETALHHVQGKGRNGLAFYGEFN